MREEQVDRPVKVSSQVRAHPAIRKLARACIALARWQREQDATESAVSAQQPPTSNIKGVELVKEDRDG